MLTQTPLAGAILECLEANASRCLDDANDRCAVLDALLDALTPLYQRAYANGKEDVARGQHLGLFERLLRGRREILMQIVEGEKDGAQAVRFLAMDEHGTTGEEFVIKVTDIRTVHIY